MSNALRLLNNALNLLDEAGAPADVGAHVDLAIHRLQAALNARSDAPIDQAQQSGPSMH